MFDAIKYRWKLRKLEKELSKIGDNFAKREKGLIGEELERVEYDEWFELEPIYEEIVALKTKRFCQIANRLMVPLPDHSDKEFWKYRSDERTLILTDKGFWELKKFIRQEKRERREGFVVWLAALTGIIGAITGLAAVLTR
jgi:hypothetical protein